MIRKAPKFNEMMKKYNTHIELAKEGIVKFTQNNVKKLICLEQDIICGLNASGQKVNNTNLIKEISQISKDLVPKDYLRLLMQYFACFDLN